MMVITQANSAHDSAFAVADPDSEMPGLDRLAYASIRIFASMMDGSDGDLTVNEITKRVRNSVRMANALLQELDDWTGS